MLAAYRTGGTSLDANRLGFGDDSRAGNETSCGLVSHHRFGCDDADSAPTVSTEFKPKSGKRTCLPDFLVFRPIWDGLRHWLLALGVGMSVYLMARGLDNVVSESKPKKAEETATAPAACAGSALGGTSDN